MQICRKCGTRLNPVEEKQQYHPACFPDHVKLPGTPMSLWEMEVREDLLEMIQWGNAESPRTQQVVLGCSEAGSPCDRKVAYRMAGHKAVNFPDPLKANIGTAYHTWLDQRMAEYQEALVTSHADWVTEFEVWPADFLKGHVDLYSRSRRLVLDWKTSSLDHIRKWEKTGIPPQYLTQIMLYGKGAIRAGYPVERVGLVALPRDGALRNVVVLTAPYDEQVAVGALRRVWQIGKTLHDLQVVGNPKRYAEIPATPDYILCSYCPFYRGGQRPADETGCPGKNLSGDPVADLFN